MKSLTKDRVRRSERARLKRDDSDGLMVDTALSSLKRGFLRGISAQAGVTAPPVSAPAYVGRGLAGDWEKVGGDLRFAMEYHLSKK